MTKKKKLLLLPLTIFLVVPLLAILIITFSSSPVIGISLRSRPSIRWFAELVSDPDWLEAALSSIIISTGASGVALLVSVPAAFACVRARIIFRSVVVFSMVAPICVPPIILALGMYFMLDPLRLFDTFPGTVLAHQAAVLPAVFLVLFARFREGNMALYDMARFLGAKPFKAAITWLANVHRATLGGAFAVGALLSFNEAIITIYVTDTNVRTVTRQAISGIARDIRPVGFAFLVIWWVLLTVGVILINVKKRVYTPTLRTEEL